MDRRRGHAITLMLSAVVVSACVIWSPNDPRLVHGTAPPRNWEPADAADRIARAKRDLGERVGSPFPDLTLIDWHGDVVRVSTWRGKRIAVLAGISACPQTVTWMKEFEESGWGPPAGFDELVVLVSTGANREWNRLVKRCPCAYFVGWPLEDFLASVSWYPIMYAVGADGVFEGFWSYGEPPVEPSANGGVQSAKG